MGVVFNIKLCGFGLWDVVMGVELCFIVFDELVLYFSFMIWEDWWVLVELLLIICLWDWLLIFCVLFGVNLIIGLCFSLILFLLLFCGILCFLLFLVVRFCVGLLDSFYDFCVWNWVNNCILWVFCWLFGEFWWIVSVLLLLFLFMFVFIMYWLNDINVGWIGVWFLL